MSKVSGRFYLRVVNAKTGEVKQEREFDNLVTNIGLEYYAKGLPEYSKRCAVGIGTNAPSASDTTLSNQIAITTINNSGGGINPAPTYERWQSFSGRFDAGAISNTITEIGIFISQLNILWCRQLILDELGNPSAITVLPNEYLDVSYTLYTYPNLQDKIFSFNMDGVVYNCVSKIALVTRTAYSSVDKVEPSIKPAQIDNCFSSQQLGDITSQPTGTNVALSVIGSLLAWDAASPYSRSNSVTLPLDVGNVQGGIGSMLLNDRLGHFYHQISFDPVLPKDNTVKMTLVFSDTVSRYSAP